MSCVCKKGAKKVQMSRLGHLEAHVLLWEKSWPRFALQWPRKSWEARGGGRCKTERKNLTIGQKRTSCETAPLTTALLSRHIWNAQTPPIVAISAGITFPREKNPAFKWRGHTRWWCWWLWVKRWVLKRRNISVTLSPITPPHCVRPQFYSHAAYIWNSTIIIMISTTVIVGIVTSWSDDHPQIMNIVAKCFRSEAIQEFRPKKCTLHTLYILNTMHNVHTTCSMHKCGPHGKAILHHIISQKSGKRIMYHPQMYSIYAC